MKNKMVFRDGYWTIPRYWSRSKHGRRDTEVKSIRRGFQRLMRQCHKAEIQYQRETV